MMNPKLIELAGWLPDWQTGNQLPIYHDLIHDTYHVCVGFIDLHNVAAIQTVQIAGPFSTLAEVYRWRKGIVNE